MQRGASTRKALPALLLLPLVAFTQQGNVIRSTEGLASLPFTCNEEDLALAGLVCSEDEPCPIFLELNSVGQIGSRIVAAGDLHSATATLYSVLLSSEDNGVTWSEPTARVRGASFDAFQAVGLTNGWITGAAQYPLARDPFFVITKDGGLNWRQRPVNEDGLPGTIQRFWFENANQGEMIVDGGKSAEGGRYGFYETQTGGDTWMIRSTTDALPKLHHAPLVPEEAQYRVSPSKDGAVLQIEKRSGNSWTTLASFRIEAANCKFAPVTPQEPKAEDDDAPKPYVKEMNLGGADPKSGKKTPTKAKQK